MYDFIYHTSEVKGFSNSEYLVILLSFVYGIVLSDQYYNISLMIRKGIYYSETAIWSTLLMLCVVVYWYFMWRNVERIDNSIFVFLLNFLPPFIFFIIISLMFPGEDEEETSLKITFLRNRRAIFILAILLVISIMYNSLLLNGNFTTLNYFRLIHTFFLLLCFHFDKRWIRNMAALWLGGWMFFLIFILGI